MNEYKKYRKMCEQIITRYANRVPVHALDKSLSSVGLCKDDFATCRFSNTIYCKSSRLSNERLADTIALILEQVRPK